MHMLLTKAVTIDPITLKDKVMGILLIVLTIVLVWVSIMSVMTHGKSGNTRRSWDVSAASILALLPAAIGISGIGIAIMIGGLKWIGFM